MAKPAPKQTKTENRKPVDNDSILKEILLSAPGLPGQLLGWKVRRVDPIITEYAHKPRRADLVAEIIRDGEIEEKIMLHLELQTSKDPDMPIRMALYWILEYLTLKPKIPIRQVMMSVDLETEVENKRYECDIYGHKVGFDVIDSKSLDPGPFLESEDWNDNVFSLYCGGDENEKLLKIKEIYRRLPTADRYDAERRLTIVANARNMLAKVKEVVDMRHVDEIMEKDTYFAGKLSQRQMKGREEGRQEGRQEGRVEIVVAIITDAATAKGWSSLPHIIEAARQSDTEVLKAMAVNVVALDEDEFLAEHNISLAPTNRH